ncbi:uncharacterized protein LOC110253060 [Exaiptasia diaphana]|uniref:Uncharacterized protein n=1 Tax=Exaiptasia diaphana TaxID=2652724 RepID=A0A913YVT8_EXADI|nr:uncharacterized protein LOC110253060 [Exaiptasia diaphana]
MSDTAAIVIPLVILVVVFLIILICYLCKRHQVWPFKYHNLDERHGFVRDAQPKDFFLVKRCEQESVRDVEYSIIQKSKFSERTWKPGLQDPQTPVMVFCVVASRIGADIDAAMREVNDWNRVILIVLHNKHSSQLTGDLSDNDYLLDDGIRSKLEDRIVHFAFSEYERLYDCRQNNEGFRKMRELIENFRYSP